MTMRDEMSDEEIIQSVVNGDRNKYAQIVERYESKLMRYAQYLLKDYDFASDAVQESFIKAFINMRSFDTKRKFSSWIYRILHNEAMNVIKRNKKIVSLDNEENEINTPYEDFWHDIKIDQQILNSQVRNCLNKIDIKYKEVLMLSYFENLKYEEISDILHIPTSTVGVRIRRGKEALKKICSKEEVEYD